MYRSLCSVLCTVVLASMASSGQAAELRQASEEMAELGAVSYWSEPSGPRSRVGFVGQRGETLATVEMDISEPSSISARVSAFDEPDRELSFVWDQVHGLLRVWPPGASKPLESSYNFQAGSWEGDPRIDEVATRYAREVGCAALALDAMLGNEPKDTPAASTPLCSDLSGTGGDGALQLVHKGISCDGFKCRGMSTAVVASTCCAEAWQEASNCCTNGICWGCCRFRECDTGCGFGDYVCICGVTGIQCSLPLY